MDMIAPFLLQIEQLHFITLAKSPSKFISASTAPQ
jgi:hypothetical protein